jgi:hypothetical protein
MVRWGAIAENTAHFVDLPGPDPIQAVDLDANGMSDLDDTGLQALRTQATEPAQREVTVGIARASRLVHYDLKHGALLEQLGRNHLLASVDEAVTALQRHP